MLKSLTSALVIFGATFAAQADTPATAADCYKNQAVFELVTDKFSHQENRWTLVNDSGETVFSGSHYAGNHQHRQPLCLDDGHYTLTVEDNYGDGLSKGHYRLLVDQKPLVEGSDFGYRDVHRFTLGETREQAARPGE